MILSIITVLLILVIYLAPGIALANLIWTDHASRTEKILFGSVIGLALSCYISVAISYAAGWNPPLIIACLLLLTAFELLLKRRLPTKGSIIGLPPWSKGELAACIICSCIVGIFLYTAFSRVGLETEMGYRYSWLFGHDFINKAVNAISLTHGAPPPHFFFAGETLRYYILPYSISALAYSILGATYSIHNIVILLSFLQAILFVFVITQFFKSWFKSATTYKLLALSFSFYSFYGIFSFFKNPLVNLGAPATLLEISSVSHLFYRLFLVEPQTVMGLMLSFVTLSLMARNEFKNSITTIATTGLLIGIEFGIEPIIGVILVLTYGLTFFYRFTFKKIQFKEFMSVAIGAATPTLIIYFSFYFIGIYSTSGGSQGLTFTLLNMSSPVIFPIITLISFGPAAIFGSMGVISLFKNKIRDNADIVVIMGCLIIIFMLTVSHENERIFGYLKGEKILFIVFLVLSGFFFRWAETWQQKAHKKLLVTLYIISLPAVLTLFVDCYQTTFSETEGVSYVSYEDMSACNWIKRNLPKNAVIQSEPQYLGSKYAYSLIANFAERKMAVGEWKVAGIKHDSGNREVPGRYHDIKNNLFKTLSIEQAHTTSQRYGINYIYIGPYERKIYPQSSMEKWQQKTNLFERVYNDGSVNIYKVGELHER